MNLAELLSAFPGALTASLDLCSLGSVSLGPLGFIGPLYTRVSSLCDGLEGALNGTGRHGFECQLYRPASSPSRFGLGLWNNFSRLL